MQHLWSLFCKTLCLSLLLCLSFLSIGAELTDLYQAEVDANQSQSQWQQAAVSAVLVKLTGGEQILSNPAVNKAIRSSSDFIKQYQMIQRDGRNLLQVSLDQQKVTSLLQQLQIPIWGSRRPDVLLWITEKTLEQPQLVVLANHPLRNALTAQAQTYGLSYLYPRYDEQELALIDPVALWSGDWSGLSVVSPAYQATQVFNLLLEQQVDMTGQLLFRLTSQSIVDGTVQQEEFNGADAENLLLQFSQKLATAQAAKYAVNVQTSAVVGDSLVFTLDGINNLADVVSVQKIFSSMLTVREQQLVGFQSGQAMIRLTLAATELDFYRALALEKQLQPVFDVEPQSAQGLAEGELGNNNALNQVATEQTSNNTSVTPEISAAEQALEAALNDGVVHSKPETVADEVEEAPPIFAPASPAIAPGHTHFKFVRP
ncbi:MAG: DUF2066 domain-containing protein [Gammaproteobacteria bacterium]|nr:DUF2066 domain-containing protein [Gammaproteobacteria bacterium]